MFQYMQRLLGRLSRIDMAVTSPWLDKQLGSALKEKLLADLPEEEHEELLKSAKTDKLDEIIRAHLMRSPNSKIVVMGTNKRAVMAVREYSEYGGDDKSVFYHGGVPEALDKFKNDPAMKVVFAVDATLKEGRNMQYADCIIRIDLPWGAGDLEQSFGRCWRFGQDKPVFLHMILARKTSDMSKFARIVAKKSQQASSNSEYAPTDEPFAFAMNEGNIAGIVDENDEQFAQAAIEYDAINQFEVDRNAQVKARWGDTKFAAGSGKQISGSVQLGLKQDLKADIRKAKADQAEWEAKNGSEAKAGWGPLKLREFGRGLEPEQMSDAEKALAFEGKIPLTVQMIASTPDNVDSPELTLCVPISAPNSDSLRRLKFTRAPVRWQVLVHSAVHATQILKHLTESLGGEYPDDSKQLLGVSAKSLVKAVTRFLSSGQFKPAVKQIEFKDKVQGIEPGTLSGLGLAAVGTVDSKGVAQNLLYLTIDQDEAGQELSALQAAKFKKVVPRYERILQKNAVQKVVTSMYRRGLSLANFEETAQVVSELLGSELVEPALSTGPGGDGEIDEDKLNQEVGSEPDPVLRALLAVAASSNPAVPTSEVASTAFKNDGALAFKMLLAVQRIGLIDRTKTGDKNTDTWAMTFDALSIEDVRAVYEQALGEE